MAPTSASSVMPLIHLMAASICLPSVEEILMVPSSSMLILAPVFSTISRITLPPVPITSRILSVGICMTSMRGACSPSARRGQRLVHLHKDVLAAVLRLGEGDLHDLLGDAGDLDVHLEGGDAPIRA